MIMDDFTQWAFIVFMIIIAYSLVKIATFLEEIRDMIIQLYAPSFLVRSKEED